MALVFDWDKIFERISTSNQSLNTICQSLGYNFWAVCMQIHRDPELQSRQAQARKNQADFIVQSVADRLDDLYAEIRDKKTDSKNKMALCQLARLEIDSIKWIACKYRPDTYGDAIKVDHNIDSIADKFKMFFSESKVEDSKPAKVTDQPINKVKDTREISIDTQPCKSSQTRATGRKLNPKTAEYRPDDDTTDSITIDDDKTA